MKRLLAVVLLATACTGANATDQPPPSIAGPKARAALAALQLRFPSAFAHSESRTPKTSAEVTLGARANDPFSITAGPATLEARALGVADVTGTTFGDIRVFPRATDDGGTMIERRTAHGVEDFLEVRDARNVVRYAVRATGALRLVARTLEVLDEHGTPRLRVAPPRVIDGEGRVHEASLELEGCAVDRDPRPPWGRAHEVRDSSCAVVVSFERDLPRPVLVDPAWTTTSSMAAVRAEHAAERLADGRVLVAGGVDPSVALSTAEIWDPTTRTWAATGAMTARRANASMNRLPDGRLLVAGGGYSAMVTTGIDQAYSTAETYDPATGIFTATPPMSQLHLGHVATALASGKIMIAGGHSGYSTGYGCYRFTELFDGATNSWARSGDMSTCRAFAAHARALDGRIIVFGGSQNPIALSIVEIYSPTAGSWRLSTSMSLPRADSPSATTLTSGKILVVGGAGGGGPLSQSVAELFDPTTETWFATGALAIGRNFHTATTLPNGNVVVVGGRRQPYDQLASTEIYDVAAGVWIAAPPMSSTRLWHTATSLLDGRILVAGGSENHIVGQLSTAETFAATANGGACGKDGDCLSTFCVDGVCCDTSCIGLCNACSRTKKGSGVDGKCEPIVAGTDPDNDCPDDGGSTCERNGLCDGAGGCQKYPSTVCSPRGCTSNSECASGFCVEGVCCNEACASPCRSCLRVRKGSGVDGVCGNVPADSNPKAACVPDPDYPASCKGDGTCNGSGSCRPFAKNGTSCGTLSCTSGSLTAARCNGTGTCVEATTSCAPFACSSSTTCGSSCASDTQCKDAWCETTTGTCAGKLARAAACVRDAQCGSGFCVDGVCCESACTGGCVACSAVKKGSGEDGVCGNVASGSDPDGDCPNDGAASCQRSGACDGRGACALFGPTEVCAAATCAGSSLLESRCDGVGKCVAAMPRDCAPFACRAGGCTASCSDDSACASDAYCDGSTCVPRRKNGDACDDARKCSSGLCVDGVCCVTACSGQCEACGEAEARGTCIPVVGAARPGRTPCAGAVDGPCSAAACDGIERKSCVGRATSAVVCQAASCVDGVASLVARCDGRGTCARDGSTKSCVPFACGDTSCKTECSDAADCAKGYNCDVAAKQCVASSTCDGDHTVRAADGSGTTDCSPLKCDSSGRCKDRCVTTGDCITGRICDGAGACVAPIAAEDEGGGCSTGRTPGSASWTSTLAAAALLTARRRRGCGSRATHARDFE